MVVVTAKMVLVFDFCFCLREGVGVLWPPLISIAICLNHFVLIEVCSVDIMVACLRISTGFKGDSFRETHLWEHFGQDRQNYSRYVSQKFNRIKWRVPRMAGPDRFPIYTEQMDAEGLGRKLLLTLSGQ